MLWLIVGATCIAWDYLTKETETEIIENFRSLAKVIALVCFVGFVLVLIS
ncbi:MAG: hypothetical protein ACOX4R_00855 [Lentihominibacter sp.]|jgi:hypothetical protein